MPCPLPKILLRNAPMVYMPNNSPALPSLPQGTKTNDPGSTVSIPLSVTPPFNPSKSLMIRRAPPPSLSAILPTLPTLSSPQIPSGGFPSLYPSQVILTLSRAFVPSVVPVIPPLVGAAPSTCTSPARACLVGPFTTRTVIYSSSPSMVP